MKVLFNSKTAADWIVAFLGNPGRRFEGTRHNAGFMAAAALEEEKKIKIKRLRFHALTASVTLGGEKVLLMMPQTYMNLSGEAVGEAARFYKVSPERIIVVSDEMALPAGKIRVRPGGSSGGHNGLKSIIEHLGTDQFPRIRIGVGEPPHPEFDARDWVISTLKGRDAEEIEKAARLAAEAVECYISGGPDRTMNKYN
ncbi:MAG: aminoacyl-tRNA hydrolase [Clostridia bacterium]|nr:aminoacyl-tRNA hydrolase [Clostridia bacterium]